MTTALTQVEFPAHYWNLVEQHTAPLAMLVVRNLTLLVPPVLAVAAVATLRLRRTACPAYFQVVNGVRKT